MKLKEAIEYFPNCILCGKELKLFLSGYDTARVYLEKADNLLKNNKLDIKIDINDNKIINGHKIINSTFNNYFLKKSCTTCRCNVTFFAEHNITSSFPEVTIHSEEIHFFDKGSDIRVTNYKNKASIYWRKTKKSQSLPVTFNFQTINNLTALKKKIHTIQLFQ